MAPVLVKAILLLTAMFEIPLANFNLNKWPNTRIAVFLLPPVMVTGSLTAIPKMISPSEPVNFLTVGCPISELADRVTASSTFILVPAYS